MLLFDEHNHPVSKKQEQEMTKAQRARCLGDVITRRCCCCTATQRASVSWLSACGCCGLLPDGDRVIIYRQQSFAFLTLLEHMEMTLSLEGKARRRAIAKARRLMQGMPARPASTSAASTSDDPTGPSDNPAGPAAYV